MINISIAPEDEGLLISVGMVVLGNVIKPKNKDVGNFIQGFGLGVGIGTISHIWDSKSPDPIIPHHDLTALVSIPTVFIMDKTNFIQNKDLANNLYGVGLGMLSQHLMTEGCSFCNTVYCKNGDLLC